MGTWTENLLQDFDKNAERHLDEYRRDLDQIFADADQALVVLGSSIDPFHVWEERTNTTSTSPSASSEETKPRVQEEKVTQEEANAAAIEYVLGDRKLPRSLAVAHYMVAAGTTHRPFAPEVSDLARAYGRFDKVVQSATDEPLLHVMHCSTEVGIIPDDARLDFTNTNRYKSSPYPFIYGIVRGASGWEAGHFAGGEGESNVTARDDFKFFPETNVLTDETAGDITGGLLETGSWYGVHTGLVAAGSEAVDATLAAFIRHELGASNKAPEGSAAQRRNVRFVATRGLLAIALLQEQGYDWVERAAAKYPEEAELIRDTSIDVTSRLCLGGITTRGDFWYVGDISSRLAAHTFTAEDRDRIVARTTELFKESQDSSEQRLADAARISGGDIELFIATYVDNFLTNILGTKLTASI